MTPDAFLQTIRQNPDDDGPRLVYADWLEERGDPLGEFIRVQCELARTERDSEMPDVARLYKREEELLLAHRGEWLGALAHLDNTESFTPCFHRGFVERINADADVFVGEHEAIDELCPMLQSAVLHRVSEFVQGVTLCPLLGRLSNLGIADWIDYDDAKWLASSRHVFDLKSIWLWAGYYPQSLEVGLALIDAPGLLEITLTHLYDFTHGLELPDDETRWRNRVEAELNERTMADRGEIFHVASSSDRLFHIRNDLEQGILAGRLADRQGLVVFDSSGIVHVVGFDRDGRRMSHESRNLTGLISTADRGEGAESTRLNSYLKQEFGFEPGLARVRSFVDPCGLAVHQFPSAIWSAIMRPETVAFTESTIESNGKTQGLERRSRNATHVIHEWIERFQFMLDWHGKQHCLADHYGRGSLVQFDQPR